MELQIPPRWHYISTFFALGRFFSFLAVSWALVGLFLLLLVVFFAFWIAAGSIFDGLGRLFEPSKPHFSMIFGVSTHASQKCFACNKTTFFSMFYKLRNMPHTTTKHVSCVAFKTFWDMVHELLQKILAGIHFLLFKTTLQRGGTCEAHGIGAELA